MKTNLFSFDLPEDLIATHPPKTRGDSRLMVLPVDNGVIHSRVASLKDFIEPGTLMVFNDTRVRKARVYGTNPETGGRGEFLFLHPTSEGVWDCVVDKAKKKRIGQTWILPGDITAEICAAPANDRRLIRLSPEPKESWFESYGHIPLPPYMRREDENEDAERYQTVYSRETGSAAAPTAGLHFTENLLDELRDYGIDIRWVTLHVGMGTFSPIRSEQLEDHDMHYERYRVEHETAMSVERAKQEGRPILAVGTTTVRTLESAWSGNHLTVGEASTNLFIYPGYRFNVVDRIFTNFHTPESSLLMLVSAFIGRERILDAYRVAVEQRYRFFSYGDAMLLG